MDLSAALVESKATEYDQYQPLSTVEQEHREILPEMLSEGDFGWRDAEWVVQWYFRRYLGAYPDEERRAVEEAFGDNTYEDVLNAFATVSESQSVENRLSALRSLDGVDVPVGSAFLFFIDPDEHVVVGDREWPALHAAGELADPYPDPPSTQEYLEFNDVCLSLADRFDVDTWTLYRALWRLGSEQEEGDDEA